MITISGKTLLIGIDGGDWKFIEPLLENGELPNLKEIIEEGAKGKLMSTIPPQTIPAWPSMFTGKDPGELGACDFSIPTDKEGNYTFANSSMWRGEFVWDCLSVEDHRVGILNVPGTYPAYPLNGTMMTGMLTPSNDPDTYPEGLLESMEYKIDPEQGTILLGKERLFEELLEINKLRFDTFKKIEEKDDFDFLALVFSITDRVQHFLLDDEEKVKKAYKILDEQIGWFTERYDNTMIVSDHGFSKLENPFFINDWLEEEGYLKKKLNVTRKVSKHLPSWITFNLLKILPEGMKKGDMPESIDFKESDAFSICDNSVSVKNPNNVEEILDKLKELNFLEVYKSNGLYDVDENFPDILINPDLGSFGYKAFQEFFEENIDKLGDHRREGIFIAFGEDFGKGSVGEIDIKDIGPTILHLFGLKKSGVKGKAVDEILRNPNRELEGVKEEKVGEGEEITKEEKEKVKERLRDLGYME